ncbi:MAG: hypothetical protein R3228_18710, partial [Halioglobus sp.]|nr:hypothetical protein [Halioglobus sp.]
MTEAEFVTSFAALLDVMNGCIGIYLTTVSGYLVTAYLVGARLTRSQLVIVSAIFVTFSALMAFVSLSLGERAVVLESQFEGPR